MPKKTVKKLLSSSPELIAASARDIKESESSTKTTTFIETKSHFMNWIKE